MIIPPTIPRFGEGEKLPFAIRLHRNQLANRFVVDTLGYSLWSVVLARNKFERIEKAGDWLAWIMAGFVLPWLLQTGFNRRYTARLQQKFKLAPLTGEKNISPLCMPFETLDTAGFKQRVEGLIRQEQACVPKVLKDLQAFGLKSFRQLTPALAKEILRGKLLILLANLLIMAIKGQSYLWFKNWMTERLSGKKGFSGEFKYASQAYLNQKSKGYEANKYKRLAVSVSLGFGSALLLPWLLKKIITRPATGKSLLHRLRVLPWLKQRVKAFNYSDAIFMSKWVLLWINLFNWALPTLLSSRDRHEFRENLTKMIAFDTLFFLGDDILAGVAAHVLQKRASGKLETSIVEYGKRLKLPKAVSLNTVFEQAGGQSKAYRLAKTSFAIGLLGTSLAMGVLLPLLNFWYTRKKVTEEQSQLAHPSQVLKPMPSKPAVFAPMTFRPVSPIVPFPPFRYSPGQNRFVLPAPSFPSPVIPPVLRFVNPGVFSRNS